MARKPSAGPASDPEILVLSSLVEGPKHGYAMMEDIATHAGVQIGPGTLYGVITRLVEQGWIEPVEAKARQRPYRITPEGIASLKAQLEAMRHLANLGLRRLRTA